MIFKAVSNEVVLFDLVQGLLAVQQNFPFLPSSHVHHKPLLGFPFNSEEQIRRGGMRVGGERRNRGSSIVQVKILKHAESSSFNPNFAIFNCLAPKYCVCKVNALHLMHSRKGVANFCSCNFCVLNDNSLIMKTYLP